MPTTPTDVAEYLTQRPYKDIWLNEHESGTNIDSTDLPENLPESHCQDDYFSKKIKSYCHDWQRCGLLWTVGLEWNDASNKQEQQKQKLQLSYIILSLYCCSQLSQSQSSVISQYNSNFSNPNQCLSISTKRQQRF